MKRILLVCLCLAGCVDASGQFDGAQTLKVTRAVAVNICRVIGVVDGAAGVLVAPDGNVRAYPYSAGGER